MGSPKTATATAIAALVVGLAALALAVANRGGPGADGVVRAIRENPVEVVTALQEGALAARREAAERREEEAEREFEGYFENPLEPELPPERAVRGPADAPLTLVEYSDFECPFCKKGLDTVNALRRKYGDKLRFVYKHLPLGFHDHARIAAQYFEAIALQDGAKAYRFHDLLFADQGRIKRGEPFLKEISRKAGADMGRLAKDLHSEAVLGRIERDEKEAARFGIQGTPGFLLNGIPVKGAYPADYFNTKIVDRLVSEGRVAL